MAQDIPPHEQLLQDAMAFCERNGWSESAFGFDAVGDPNFLFGLRKNRQPRWDTIQRVREWMDKPTRRPKQHGGAL